MYHHSAKIIVQAVEIMWSRMKMCAYRSTRDGCSSLMALRPQIKTGIVAIEYTYSDSCASDPRSKIARMPYTPAILLNSEKSVRICAPTLMSMNPKNDDT